MKRLTSTELAAKCREMSGDALRVIGEIMNDKEENSTARFRCAEFIVTRAFGKPVEVYIEPPTSTIGLTDAELEAIARAGQPRGRARAN
jgi:hypothetical protein